MAELLGSNTRSPMHADDDVRDLFYKIDQGIKRRRRETDDFWAKNEAFDDGRHWDQQWGTPDDIKINKVASWINTHIAQTVFHNPTARLTPKSPSGYDQVDAPIIDPETGPVVDPMPNQMTGQIEMVPRTRPISRHKIVEGLTNNVAHGPQMGLKDTLRRFVRASQLGYGVLKVGYKPLLKPWAYEQRRDPETDPETGLPRWDNYEIQRFDDGRPMLDARGKVIPIRTEEGYLIPIDGGVVSDLWFVDWVHYRHMIIDPNGGNNFRTHDWVAEEYVRSLKDVQNDPRYKNTKDLVATGQAYIDDPSDLEHDEARVPGMDTDGRSQEPFIKDQSEVIRLFEFWDLKNKRVIILADGHGEKLLDEPIPAGIDHSPYVFYRPFERITKTYEFYPKPPVTDLICLNDELNKARKMQMAAFRKETRKYLYDRARIKDAEAKKLTSPEDMQFIGVDLKPGESLLDAITPVPNTPVSPALFGYIKNIELNFDEVAGQPSEARGQARAETATQVENMQLHATLRVDDQRNQLADCLAEMFKKLTDSIQTNMTTEQAVTIMGPEGQSFQTFANDEMIIGDYDHSVDVEEMTPRNRAVQMAQFTQFMNMVLGGGEVSMQLLQDREGNEALFELYGITDQRIINAITNGMKRALEQQQAAQQMQMQMQQEKMQQDAAAKQADQEMKTDDQRLKIAQMATKQADVISQSAAGRQ